MSEHNDGGAAFPMMSAAAENLKSHQRQLDADGTEVGVSRQALDEALSEYAELLGALLLLTGNPHIDLGDLIYQVREREGEGWDGPAVLAWGEAIRSSKSALAKMRNAS